LERLALGRRNGVFCHLLISEREIHANGNARADARIPEEAGYVAKTDGGRE